MLVFVLRCRLLFGFGELEGGVGAFALLLAELKDFLLVCLLFAKAQSPLQHIIRIVCHSLFLKMVCVFAVVYARLRPVNQPLDHASLSLNKALRVDRLVELWLQFQLFDQFERFLAQRLILILRLFLTLLVWTRGHNSH